jgi:hypothetical protein
VTPSYSYKTPGIREQERSSPPVGVLNTVACTRFADIHSAARNYIQAELRTMMKRAFLILSLTALLGISGCGSGTNPIVVAISSPTGAQALDVGQTFNITASVSNDKLAKGATFLLTGAGTLSNQTATSATYTASASGNGTITVASASDPTKTKTITVVVTAAPSITSATTLSPATEGAAYTGNIAVTGGAGSLNYSVTVGSLPAGLSLNSSTGAITGTATGPGGTVNFTVQVKDSSTVSPQTNRPRRRSPPPRCPRMWKARPTASRLLSPEAWLHLPIPSVQDLCPLD